MFEIGKEFSFSKIIKNLTTKRSLEIIIILGVIVFFSGLFNDFVIDDNSQITKNVLVHSVSNIPSFFTGSTFYGGSKLIGIYYKPVTLASLSLIYSAFGPNPLWFHLFQGILHITNASILFLLFKRFFSKPISLVLALLFLVHPINSESVFYISNMQEVLFFLFGIVALWLLVNFQLKKYFVLVLLFLFLSILSKETGILFFFISIIYIFLTRKQRLYSLLGSSTLVLTLYFILRVNAVGIFNQPLNAPIASTSLPERLINIPAILFFYLKTFLVPINLASSYQWVYREISFNHFFLPLVICIVAFSVIFLVALKLYRTYPRKYFDTYIFFGIWFFAGLFIHLQILPLDATVAERWFYFPIVGLLGMMGVIMQLYKPRSGGKWIMIAVSTVILVFLSARTIIRSFDWRNDYRLAMHDIQVSKSSYTLEHRISYALAKQGKFEEAKIRAERSISMYPYFTNYNNLGSIYLNLKEFEKSKQAYLKGLQFGDYYAIYENLALLSLVYGDQKENVEFINDALIKFPQNAKLWFYLAILEYKINNINEAKIAIHQAYRYSKSQDILSVYNKIMNEQPLNLNVTFEY